MYLELQKLIERCGKVCQEKGWDKDWRGGGCYLHLEVSEFIESLRGKGDSTPTVEASDIIMVLFSMLDHNKINIINVIETLDNTLVKLEVS